MFLKRSVFLLLVCLVFTGCSSGSNSNDNPPVDLQTADGGQELTPADTESTDLDPGLDQVAETTVDGLDDPDLTPADVQPDVPWQPPFDPTVCGAAPHTWLPPDGMGEVVMFEELMFSNLDPQMTDEMLDEAGYGFFGKAKYTVRNFRMRYVTQDHGQKIEATAIIGVPVGDDVPWPAPTLAWLHGTTGFMDDCAPSTDPLLGPVPTTLWAAQGYVTVAPDYIGLVGFGEPSPPGSIHPYLVAEATAISSLDSIRALFNVLDENPDLGQYDSQQIVLVGGSQGGHAAFFTERYWPHYSPEFDIVAVAAAVPPMDLRGQAQNAVSGIVDGSGNLLAMIVGMKQWYGIPEDLSAVFTDQEPLFIASVVEEEMAGSCHPDVDLDAITKITDAYLPSFVTDMTDENWEAVQPWECFLTQNSIPGTSVPKASDVPYLTPYAELDTLVVTAVEKKQWLKNCEQGYRMEYLECAGLGHSKGALSSLAYVRVWLDARLAGEPWDEDIICVMTEPVDCLELVK
jgi:hypothetical protein